MDPNSQSSLPSLFAGYDDAESAEVYEDELYPEESSSEQSVDSEVEFHLYSQIHYSQDLGEVSALGVESEADVGEVTGPSAGLTEKQGEDENLTELAGGGTQLPDEPEVIVLSDSPDEDSIYTSKAQRPGCSSAPRRARIHLLSSTPNHTKAAARNALCPPESAVGAPRQRSSPGGRPAPVLSAGPQALHDVLVVDNSSEEEEEEESLISDSEDIESWMLLGAGADDSDGDIMLNLEGCATPVRKGKNDVNWSISHKDLEAQISNYAGVRHSSVRYYRADKNVTCRNCHRPGHLSKNCPTPKACPEIWRQYHLTTKPGPIKAGGSASERAASVYCYNCSRQGHLGYECSEKRMQGNMFPTSPFVCYYDDECDIRRRASRLKRKVADLQEAGLLPEQSETPPQEEQLELPSHRKKSKLWKEHRGKHSRSSEQHKKMKGSRAKKAQEGKHRRAAGILGEPEEFPRGGRQQGCRGSRARRKAPLQALPGSRAVCVQQPLEGAKRKKKWKKQRVASPDSRDNLFLIKQRKKKSKQKSW
ncbi:zinc finger CCHC domain-containing protein 7 isoform X2 [Motacilla alba alba]|uniref:zinc finger CCHC domain-containing protein 7 isoform X2 n=1 Tax=Motacilla alba alba TaxID=1094192 RepID=UPI0018D50C99|nr:zinc finger CCHC domain-containing protein 7 isoform X2 [Motacilla alba alba]